MDNITKKFNVRAFVVLVLISSGLGLPVTGLANHLLGFLPLTRGRHAWMSAHNALGILFVIFTIWHLILNHRALWNYIKGVAMRVPPSNREAAFAGAVVLLVLLLFVGHALHAGG